MKRFFRKLKSTILTIIGGIKIFKLPMFIVYDPVLYRINGSDMRKLCNSLKVGDIVMRAYHEYLDSKFIPGKYSHSGVYVGDGIVIHAVAEGVCKIDVLDFFQADNGIIVRLKDRESESGKLKIEQAVKQAHANIGKQYDFFFAEGDDAFYCHEHTASCFKGCNIKKHVAKALFGLIKTKEPVYLAQSFIESPDFEVVLEV